jgi:hypothetical protein
MYHFPLSPISGTNYPDFAFSYEAEAYVQGKRIVDVIKSSADKH